MKPATNNINKKKDELFLEHAMTSKKAASIAGMFFFLLIVIENVFPSYAQAYVDPGTTGMLSQILYVLFYGMLGIFFYCLRYIKGFMAKLKEFLIKCIRPKA